MRRPVSRDAARGLRHVEGFGPAVVEEIDHGLGGHHRLGQRERDGDRGLVQALAVARLQPRILRDGRACRCGGLAHQRQAKGPEIHVTVDIRDVAGLDGAGDPYSAQNGVRV